MLLNSSGATLCTITLPATTCTFAPTQPCEQQVVASYGGDVFYPSGFSNVVVMTIPPVLTEVTFVSVAPNPTAVGTATTATVTVAKHPLFAPATGTIRVVESEGGGLLCTITLPATSCAFTPLAPGAPRLNARYLGDAIYEPNVSNSPQLVVVGITSAVPPGGSVGTAYSHTYVANATLAYAVTSGALPPGLTLAGNGVLSGTPTTAGTFTGVVTGTTGSVGTAQAFSIAIGATIPGAPTIGVATAGNAQATVTFTPPASTGGSAITSYTVTSSPAGFSASGPASPITVSNLANGTAYTFTVTATNSAGTGPASPPSNSVTPATVPGAPAIGPATAGDSLATVAFTPPFSNGGSAVTSYTVTSSPGGFTASGPASPITVSGLTNGTAYTFTVTATNAVGTGPPSAASNSATPAAFPGSPTGVVATAGNAQATVAFTPPISSGGTPITSYTVTSSPGGFTAIGPASPITVGGLTNGTAYTFTVTATNAVGAGPASAPSNSVTPAGVPGAPTIAFAAAGNTQAGIAFTPPPSNGSPITSYTATSSPGGIVTSGAASPIIVSGLTNGTAYTFTVTATNAVGTGPASAPSNSVTPAAVPGPPTIGPATAGNTQATVTFTPPTSTGGSAITTYTVTSSPGGISVSGAASPITVA
ncbi:MAG: fibronectin type III domain-containing protein, partial [Phycisphaerae bacterium]